MAFPVCSELSAEGSKHRITFTPVEVKGKQSGPNSCCRLDGNMGRYRFFLITSVCVNTHPKLNVLFWFF